MKLFIFLLILLSFSWNLKADLALIPLKYSKYLEIYKDQYSSFIKFKRSPGNLQVHCLQIAGVSHKMGGCDNFQYFSRPLNNIGISSSTFYGFIKELNAVEKIKLVTNGAIIPLSSAPLVRLPQDIKNYLNSNIEALISFSYGDTYFNREKGLEKLKIPVIYINEFVEAHPLARAEWIKVFGILLGMEEKSKIVFKEVEENYWKIKNETQKQFEFQKIPCQIIYGDINSNNIAIIDQNNFFFYAFKDLHCKLVNSSENNKSVVNLKSVKIESLYNDLIGADFWINTNPLIFNRNNLNNKKINKFKSFVNNTIYTLDFKKSNEYWVLLSVRPDLILKDLGNIIWGNSKIELSYFKKI